MRGYLGVFLCFNEVPVQTGNRVPLRKIVNRRKARVDMFDPICQFDASGPQFCDRLIANVQIGGEMSRSIIKPCKTLSLFLDKFCQIGWSSTDFWHLH